MESLGHEVVPFEDVVCQMWDMLKLGDRSYVTLQVRLKIHPVLTMTLNGTVRIGIGEND